LYKNLLNEDVEVFGNWVKLRNARTQVTMTKLHPAGMNPVGWLGGIVDIDGVRSSRTTLLGWLSWLACALYLTFAFFFVFGVHRVQKLRTPEEDTPDDVMKALVGTPESTAVKFRGFAEELKKNPTLLKALNDLDSETRVRSSRPLPNPSGYVVTHMLTANYAPSPNVQVAILAPGDSLLPPPLSSSPKQARSASAENDNRDWRNYILHIHKSGRKWESGELVRTWAEPAGLGGRRQRVKVEVDPVSGNLVKVDGVEVALKRGSKNYDVYEIKAFLPAFTKIRSIGSFFSSLEFVMTPGWLAHPDVDGFVNPLSLFHAVASSYTAFHELVHRAQAGAELDESAIAAFVLHRPASGVTASASSHVFQGDLAVNQYINSHVDVLGKVIRNLIVPAGKQQQQQQQSAKDEQVLYKEYFPAAPGSSITVKTAAGNHAIIERSAEGSKPFEINDVEVKTPDARLASNGIIHLIEQIPLPLDFEFTVPKKLEGLEASRFARLMRFVRHSLDSSTSVLSFSSP
jgi:hypothetical protein